MKINICSWKLLLLLLMMQLFIHLVFNLKNQIRATSQLENLKDKYKDKILFKDNSALSALNDTLLIAKLENRIKFIYKKLNLKTDELIHLEKITNNPDEYIVFLKILIDRLSSIQNFNYGSNKSFNYQMNNNSNNLVNNKTVSYIIALIK